jgi:ABC-type transport system substrate-binding protein
MRLTCLRWLAASSLLIAVAAGAATRPRYGGTLHVETSTAVMSLDPAEAGPHDFSAGRNIASLLFDTLVVLDDHGVPQPSLADSWTPGSGNQRWQFVLRHGVTFSDGLLLTSEIAAASLRRVHPEWKVTAQADTVIIQMDSPAPDFPAELSLLRNAIVLRDGKVLGTGPFIASQWDPGKRLVLTAREDYRGGRAFLDSVEIEMNKAPREQAIALELGRADVIDIAPEQSRRAVVEGRHIVNSAPVELMALLFVRDSQAQGEQQLREALSLSIDRGQLNRVLLQNDGEAAANLLPNWMTGYNFLFSSDTDLSQAKQLGSSSGQSRTWTLAYDDGDALARLVAERVILNARDTGLNIQLSSRATADIRLVRVPLASSNPRIALTELLADLGIPLPNISGASTELLYSAENDLLHSRRVIPLLHLRIGNSIGANVQDWSLDADGSWQVPNAWLTTDKP